MAATRTITPARIAEFIGFERCPRYFKHTVQDVSSSWHHNASAFKEAFVPLNILLTKAGEEFEEEVLEATGDAEVIDLARDVEDFYPDHDTFYSEVLDAVGAPRARDAPTLLYQASLKESIGVWTVPGDADIVAIWPTADGAHVRVIDVKSAREEKSYHQIQAATYVDIIETLIDSHPDLDTGTVTADAGIITRETEFDAPTPKQLPEFDPEPRILDVRRLLGADGTLTQIADTDFEDVTYQLNQKCTNCAYNEACMTDAMEDCHVRLLGLTPAQQETLAEHGIETLEDLVDICRTPEDDWYPTTYEDVSFQQSSYHDLKSTPGIGEMLPTLIYRAEALLDYFDPDGGERTDRPRPWIAGTGRCPLPEDDPDEETGIKRDWKHGSMVRVYLNVQADHLRNSIMQLSARVSATASETDSQRISEVVDRAPDGKDARQATERSLLERFIERLYSAIRDVADGISFEGIDQTDPPLHFYLYSHLEQTILDEAFERHDTPHINSFRSILESPGGHDRPMVSELRPIVGTRLALETPIPGLLPAYESVYPTGDSYRKPMDTDKWSYTPPDAAESAHLRDVFNHRLFDFKTACERKGGDGVSVTPRRSAPIDGVPTRVRDDASIPLGYLWAAVGRIDDEWVAAVEEDYDADPGELNQYRFHDADSQTTPIDRADVQALGRHFCDSLEHIERALDTRDAQLTKEPYPLDKLAVDRFSPPDLSTAADKYLWIEHTARRREEYEHYRKQPSQRMLSGKTLPVTITSVEERNSRKLYVEGKLRFDQPFQQNADRIQRALRKKGSDGTTSGSWMVANPYDFGQTETTVVRPYKIEGGVQVTLDTLDTETGDISFVAQNYFGDSDEYGRAHDTWTTDERYDTDDSNAIYFAPGEQVILDPQTDDITASRITTALDYAETNALHDVIEDIRQGVETAPTTNYFQQQHLDQFADWLDTSYGPGTLPSDRQREFITEADAQLVGLQGPPGTGKTAGAFAPALCARMVAAAATETHRNGLVTAPSNTAIDEMLEDTAELLAACADSDDHRLPDCDSIEIVRIADDEPPDAPPNVTYIDYNDDDDAEALDRLSDYLNTADHAATETGSGGQSKLGQFDAGDGTEAGGGEATQTLVFATPARSWRLTEHISPSDDDADVADQAYWDLLAADEASMLTIPEFLLAGASLVPRGQVLVGGDHRQLPPVQKHDWEEETRRDIRSAAPYLPTLDYLRLLRGDDDVIDKERRDDWHHDRDPETVTLPLVQLTQTHRFGPTTAAFAHETIYKQDGIEYTSSRTPDPLSLHYDALNDGVEAILDSESSVVLVTYDGADYQQWNPIEAALTVRLIDSTDDDTSMGVVTPHNAQRSHIESQAGDITDAEEITVETVNRFQGGEQDLMICSATVSDPQYILAESDFLLQENRVNVSFTRHRDKLVVLAPRSLLGYIPTDPDLYDDATIWKTLAQQSGEAPSDPSTSPDWSGSLANLLGGRWEAQFVDGEITIEVYDFD